MHALAVEKIKAAGLEHLVRVELQSAYKADFTGASVIYTFSNHR